MSVVDVTPSALHALMRMIAGSESYKGELTVLILSFVVWSCEEGMCGEIVSLDMMFLYYDNWRLHPDDPFRIVDIAPLLVCEHHLCKCTTKDIDLCDKCHELSCEICAWGCVCGDW